MGHHFNYSDTITYCPNLNLKSKLVIRVPEKKIGNFIRIYLQNHHQTSEFYYFNLVIINAAINSKISCLPDHFIIRFYYY